MRANWSSRSSILSACTSRPWRSTRSLPASARQPTGGRQRGACRCLRRRRRSLREQALPLTFRAAGAKALTALAVGQPVRVFVQGKEQVKGIAVPVASLMKNPANQTIVG